MSEKKNVQFLNSFYHKRQKNEETGKWEKDRLEIVYRNIKNGKKGIKVIEEPSFHFYQLKDEYEQKALYYEDYIDENKVVPVVCKYSNLLDTLAQCADNSITDENSNTQIGRLKKSLYKGSNKALMKLHQLPIFYGSDIDIQDYYKGLYLDKFDSSNSYLTKGYFDIEVDIKDHVGFPDEEEAPCPVNALTFVNDANMTAYVLLLRNPENPLIKEFEDNIDNFKKELEEEFTEIYGNFEYRFLFFDKEVGLIKTFFDLVNDLKPDFMMAWNIRFDIVTLINRLKNHGINPADVICHPDFTKPVCDFYIDRKNSLPEDKNDYFNCSSYSVYVDQLLFYAQLRKGLGKKESYTLNAIATEELGDAKIDYTEVGTLSDLPYENYKMFVKYNIKDVLLCYKLEQKNQDASLFYTIAEITRTRLNKAMKKTISLKNIMYKFARDRKLVMGNNMNIKYYDANESRDGDKQEVTEKFEG